RDQLIAATVPATETNAVVPGCARSTPRPKSIPATAMPLLMRNFFRVSDLFMSATLRRAHQIYFSNIAIFFRRHSALRSPLPRRRPRAVGPVRTDARADNPGPDSLVATIPLGLMRALPVNCRFLASASAGWPAWPRATLSIFLPASHLQLSVSL